MDKLRVGCLGNGFFPEFFAWPCRVVSISLKKIRAKIRAQLRGHWRPKKPRAKAQKQFRANLAKRRKNKNYIYLHTPVYIYIYTCMYLYMYVYMYVCMYVCLYVHMYMYIHTHTYMHAYIHTYIHIYQGF